MKNKRSLRCVGVVAFSSLWLFSVVNFRDALAGAVRGSFCAVTSAGAGAVGLIGDSLESLTGSGLGAGAAAGALSNLADLACNQAPSGGGLPPPQFEGGQCPGGTYQAGVLMAGGSNYLFTGLVGPIGSFTCEPNGSGSTIFLDGVQIGASQIASRACPITLIAIGRTDGQPDDCGDPPPTVPPYVPGDYTDNPSVDFDDDDGNPVNINPTLIFAPVTVAVNGEINVPVNIEFNDGSSLFGDFNLSTGDISFGGGGGNGPNEEPKPTRDDPSVDGDDPGQDDDTFADPIIAVYVKVTDVQPGAKITEIDAVPIGGELNVPRLGWVTFQCLIEDGGGRAWTHDIDVRYRSQIIPCPVSWGAVNVNVEPQSGVTLIFTALRGKTTRQLVLEATQS